MEKRNYPQINAEYEKKMLKLLSKEIDSQIIYEGILLGYPDRAILDFAECLRNGDIRKDLIEANIIFSIPEAGKYEGAIPEFD